MRRLLLAAIAVLILSGCNTMFQKTYQKITVRTPGVEDADCILTTETNKYRALSSRLVLIERSRQPLTVSCEKVGYYTGTTTVKSRIYLAPAELNLFNGILPGTVYDYADNSVFDYPDVITINMVAKPEEPQPPPEPPYVTEKKPVEVQPEEPPTVEEKAKTEDTFSKTLQK